MTYELQALPEICLCLYRSKSLPHHCFVYRLSDKSLIIMMLENGTRIFNVPGMI